MSNNNCSLDLPNDKQKIINTLLNKIESEYKDDISIVVCYRFRRQKTRWACPEESQFLYWKYMHTYKKIL